MSCAILSCENSKINCRSFAISLFSIPKNENIKQIWLRNARLENLSEKQKSKVFLCEKHFERKLINFSQFTTRLAIGSVPIPIIESPEEGVNNQQHFCRICESKEELINLEQSKNVKIVIEMLTTIANVTFSLDDQLPHMICQKCKEKVVLSFEFKYQIEATDRKLRQLLLKESSKIDVAEAAVEESISSNACDTNIESKPPNVDMNETTKDHKPMMKVVVLLPGNTMKNDGHTIKYPSINRIYFECYICKKSFKTRKPLWAHQMRSHMATDKRNVSTNKCCSVCSKEFSDLNNLERHIRDVHEQLKTYKCNMCDKLYAQKATCVSHEMTHNADLSVRCTICDKLLKNPKNLRLHHRHIHEGQKRVRQKLHKTYRACEYCGKRIRTPNYRLHLRVHTGEKPYKCNYCDKFFSTITGRTYHSRIHTGEKPYKCNVCNKLFTRINSMVLHSRTHTDEKPYKCTMCDKKFRQLPHLSVHMSIHTGEKNHKCDTCGKAFAHRATLICHIRQHTGETPYQCTVCSKKFFDLNGLKRHRKVHQ